MFLFQTVGATPVHQEQILPVVPYPKKVTFQRGYVNLPRKGFIYFNNPLAAEVANIYKKQMAASGFDFVTGNKSRQLQIQLFIEKTPFERLASEAYTLEVNSTGIRIGANEQHGLYNALQTLRQLIQPNRRVYYCKIQDEPSYSWRGFMVDVGRNYQPVSMIKEQIDAMALLKMNVFHFHATENVAWRFESKKYPQLNAPEHMTRNKGAYYTEAELKEIIKYCRERFIEFVPEIDMPGHSEAFTRAMGFNMQTEQGLATVKELVKEFCDAYDFKYLHLGADEVKITMPSFVPEMVKFVNGLDKKIVAWWPGRIHDDGIVRNLWLGDVGEKEDSYNVENVDSRHTYLNHLDPLESVVALYFRQYNDVQTGNKLAKGATICNWPDRRVNEPGDAIKANAVYPAMIAFADRIWRGGGINGYTSNIPIDPFLAADFAKFEQRLLTLRNRFFKNMVFTYTQQADITWDLFGPYDNKGDVNANFPIENDFLRPLEKPFQSARGGTVILRHFWAPLISGLLSDPTQNSTIYARRRIWSEKERTAKFWISFNNISRSPATDSPPINQWNFNNGKVWVNNQLIAPPMWNRGSEKGDPEVPLTDEDYAYRKPNLIKLKKGWNEIWLKVPVAGFKGKDWQNPVKWMFTFAEVR